MLAIDTEKLFHEITSGNEAALDLLIKEYDIQAHAGPQILEMLIEASPYNKSEIARHMGGSNYIYEISKGVKQPSRDKLLEILLFINIELKTIQRLLKLFGHAPLYPKNERDIYIIYAITNNYSLLELDDLLQQKKFQTLLQTK